MSIARVAVGTLILGMVVGCSSGVAPPDASVDSGAANDLTADVVSVDAGADVPANDAAIPSDGATDGGAQDVAMGFDATVDGPAAMDAPAVMDTPAAMDAPTVMDILLTPDSGTDVTSGTDGAHDAGPSTDLPTTDASGVIAPPRLIAPISVMRVTSQRPTLHWTLPAGVTGARVQLCSDRPCGHVLMTLDAVGNSVRPTTALSPGVVYWRAYGRAGTVVGATSSPTWEFVVGHRDTPVDSSYGRIKDFDGDGYDDLAVGAYGANYSPTSEVRGAVYIYRGSPSGLSSVPLELPPSSVFEFGATALHAGDLNGDGLADLVVANANDLPLLPPYGEASGSVCVFYGRRSGLSATPDLLLRLPSGSIGIGGMGFAMAVVHDINGDGFDDVAISDGWTAWLYLGGPSGIHTIPDGSDPSPPDPSVTGAPLVEDLGSVGDVNGDGYADVFTAQDNAGVDGATTGVGALYWGTNRDSPTTSPALIPPPRQVAGMNAFFGLASSSIGDYDHDGSGDFAVFGGGYVFLYRGSNAATFTPIQFIDGRSMSSFAHGAQTAFGSTLGTPGDSDGNGLVDLLVGSNEISTAYWYPGQPSSLPAVLGRTWLSPPHHTFFSPMYGVSFTSIGDVNADGFEDVAIGSLYLGEVDVLYGSASGPSVPVVLTDPHPRIDRVGDDQTVFGALIE